MKLKEFVGVFYSKSEVVNINEWQRDYMAELYVGRIYSIPENLLNCEVDYVLRTYSIERKEKILCI